jgi:hypothetical protein
MKMYDLEMYGIVVGHIVNYQSTKFLENLAEDVIKKAKNGSDINEILKMPFFMSTEEMIKCICDFTSKERFIDLTDFDKNALIENEWTDGYDETLADNYDSTKAIDLAKFLNNLSKQNSLVKIFNDMEKSEVLIRHILEVNYKFLPELWRTMDKYNETKLNIKLQSKETSSCLSTKPECLLLPGFNLYSIK